ncbi:MAG: ORF6N domain-containing protein [Bacteroidaceae bacterium]|jgi:hypothetical protein|nr:ORF6N domain-containing protein [Bacteroidaceae bacterium]
MNDLEPIKRRIYEIRGRKIMLDADLAELYCVETRALNQAVKRNIERFPDDFMFPLTREEWETLKANSQHTSILTSQNVILKKNGRGQHSKYPPLAFTRAQLDAISDALMELQNQDNRHPSLPEIGYMAIQKRREKERE